MAEAGARATPGALARGTGPRRRVALTRPRADCEDLAREVEARGWSSLIAPLLEIIPEPVLAPDLNGVQAIVLTSANAAPFLKGLPARLPVYAVGDASAAAVRQVHSGPVISGGGDGATLARLVVRSLDPARGVLLHLVGRDVRPEPAATLRAAGFELRATTVYRAEPAARLPQPLEQALRAGALDAITFFSPRTARTFERLVREARLSASVGTVDALCLSPAVGQALAGLAFRQVAIAAAPERAAVLRLLDGVP